ncbi:MAG: Phosphoenolpyruvate synthase [uncultured Corynebacteriales bacterium]|uniref:Phosphoenolpyruvate synthase n=1 Tax=uncultured Mycobacteriales bacterium TaxID=581187 RepID=A0A6J4K298_9ACTN|nr:MAG: Phosphoenolpyruvate synthase [uncultured Corynebacteriales bacterium]
MQLTALGDCFAELGPKAARLRDLAAHGFPVPEAYVVPSLPAGPDGLPDQLVEDLRKLMDGPFAGVPVVVRSSASDEDLPLANAPGVYESFLDRRTVEQVVTAVELCRRSLDSAEARAYRRLTGGTAEPVMSVLVQRMVACDYAGVLYTRHPTAETGTMLAEATAGLGTAVVAGLGATDRFALQRRRAWTRPESWSVGETTLPELLTVLGHLLEEHFGGPQDVEWGVADGQLHVFQSRDAALSRVPLPLPGARPATGPGDLLVVSPGYAVGRLSADGPPAAGDPPTVVLLDDLPTTRALEALAPASGLLVRRGTVCSHSAALCRELGLPVAVAPPDVDRLLGAPVLLDAVVGTVRALADLPPVDRKKGIFAAVRQLAARRVGPVVRADRYEGVVFDPVAQGRILAHLARGGAPVVTVRQRILPYDDPDRTYCGISARIQLTGDSGRVQFKRANVLPDRPYRFDEEVHVPIDRVTDGERLLELLGYRPFEPQERSVEVVELPGLRVCVNTWPGAPQSYLGIETDDPAALLALLDAAGVPVAECGPLDGKDLFDRMGVRLDRLTFGAR